MSQYEGMDTVHSRVCLHRACPHFKCVGGDPGKNATAFFDELRVRRFNRWVRDERRRREANNLGGIKFAFSNANPLPMHYYCGTRHRPGADCVR